jgi:CDP-glycerol glycerophosphotransferase (TagB/SpsB family)
VLDPFVSKFVFARKDRILADNLEFFAGLDALVATERHCARLRTKHHLTNLKLIHTRHGAGDRKGTTDAAMALFDLVLLPGCKYAERFSRLGYLRPGHFAIAGWPKFEAVRAQNPVRRRVFANANPVVVYNPHFKQRVGSWARMGRSVLDFFVANPDYNLIFAPHLVLFKRRWRQGAPLPDSYRRAPNILIDTDSAALTDMTYLDAADIYLGDVSSQVYEFLIEPRPCIFLDAHGVDWKNDPHYAHWRFGPVVTDVARDLGSMLDEAFASHARYLPAQRAGFAETFHQDPASTAAQRGADAIADYLRGRPPAAILPPASALAPAILHPAR